MKNENHQYRHSSEPVQFRDAPVKRANWRGGSRSFWLARIGRIKSRDFWRHQSGPPFLQIVLREGLQLQSSSGKSGGASSFVARVPDVRDQQNRFLSLRILALPVEIGIHSHRKGKVLPRLLPGRARPSGNSIGRPHSYLFGAALCAAGSPTSFRYSACSEGEHTSSSGKSCWGIQVNVAFVMTKGLA